ncbi:hypothetical protein, partial [Flagellimonas marinaquae]
DVIAQVEGAAELSTAIAALESQIATLQDAVGELPDGNALSGGLSALEDQITALETELASLAETGATSEELATLVEGLTSDLDLLKDDLAELLENSNVLTGDLVIFDQNSLDAALSLGDRVAIVNGEVKIIGDNFEAGVLDAVTSKIVAVTNDVHIQTDKSLDFSNLETVGDDLEVVGSPIDLSGLKSVGDDLNLAWDGDYDFPGLDLVGSSIRLGVEVPEIEIVGKGASASKGTPRSINFRNVKATRVEVLYDAYMGLSDGVYDMDMVWEWSDDLDLYFPNATSVVFGDVPVRVLFAPMAETVELHYEDVLPGIEGPGIVVITSAESVTVKASEIEGEIAILAGASDIDFNGADFDELTLNDFYDIFYDGDEGPTFVEFLGFPAEWNAQINLPNLAAVQDDLYLISNTLTMPLLEGFDLEQDGYDLLLTQENVSLPNLTVEGNLYAARTVTAELASISNTYIQDASILESLKLNAQLNDATPATIGVYDYAALSSLTIIGSTELEGEEAIEVAIVGPCTDCNGWYFNVPKLKTVELGGNILSATLAQLPEMTSLTTSGNINSLTIGDNDALVTLALGHEHISGLDGASLTVAENDALESVVTDNLDYLSYVSVTNNESLTSIDLSSWKRLLVDFTNVPDAQIIGANKSPSAGRGQILLGAQITVIVSGNDLSGEITNYIPETGTTAEQPGLIRSADLFSLNNIIDALEAYAAANEIDSIKQLGEEFSMEFTIDNVDDTETPTTVEDNPLTVRLLDCSDYTWTETQDIISIVPIEDCEDRPKIIPGTGPGTQPCPPGLPGCIPIGN